MTAARDELRTAIDQRSATRATRSYIATALAHAEGDVAQLEDRRGELEAEERRRSENLAARIVEAARAGVAMTSAERRPDTAATERRLARLEVADQLETATTIVADLRQQLQAADKALEIAVDSLTKARHAVMAEDANEQAQRLVAARIEVGRLTRRLKAYHDTRPIVGGRPELGVAGIRVLPPDVAHALYGNVPDASSDNAFALGGVVHAPWRFEADAWQSYWRALDSDANAAPDFPR